jgi:hypothetical protein
MNTDFANIEGIFNTNTGIVQKAITDIALDDWFRHPGDASNHLTFVMGHLAVHRGRVVNLLGGNWAAPWSKLFTRGTERVAREEYPKIEEIKNAWSDASEQLAACFKAASPELLSQPAPEGPPSFDQKISGVVAFLAFHEAYHVGQVSYLRKWLGYGQTVG